MGTRSDLGKEEKENCIQPNSDLAEQRRKSEKVVIKRDTKERASKRNFSAFLKDALSNGKHDVVKNHSPNVLIQKQLKFDPSHPRRNLKFPASRSPNKKPKVLKSTGRNERNGDKLNEVVSNKDISIAELSPARIFAFPDRISVAESPSKRNSKRNVGAKSNAAPKRTFKFPENYVELQKSLEHQEKIRRLKGLVKRRDHSELKRLTSHLITPGGDEVTAVKVLYGSDSDKIALRDRSRVKPAQRFSFENFEDPYSHAKRRRRNGNRKSETAATSNDIYARIKTENPLWKEIGNRIERLLRNIRFSETFIEAFESDGYSKEISHSIPSSKKSISGNEKVKPIEEIIKNKRLINIWKLEVKEKMRKLMSNEHYKFASKIMKGDVTESEEEDIFICAVCGGDESTALPGNEMIRCDHSQCNLAYHQKCCLPIISDEEFASAVNEHENDYWFCRRCAIYFDQMNNIIETIGIDIDTHEEIIVEDLDEKSEVGTSISAKPEPEDIIWSDGDSDENESFEDLEEDEPDSDSLVSENDVNDNKEDLKELDDISTANESALRKRRPPKRRAAQGVNYAEVAKLLEKNGELNNTNAFAGINNSELDDDEDDSDFQPEDDASNSASQLSSGKSSQSSKNSA